MVYVPSLLFHTHFAVPTSCWHVVQFAEGCAAVSQLIVVAAAAGPASATAPTMAPSVSRPAATPRESHAAALVRGRRSRPMLTMRCSSSKLVGVDPAIASRLASRHRGLL